MNLTQMAKNVRTSMVKHSPEILTGLGIVGMITTTVLAVKATPKALTLIDVAENEKCDELTPMETVKATWKCYIPAAVTGVTSIACIVGASSVNTRRNAALAAAYTLSDTAMREYREKVIETIGEKKELTVNDKVSEKKVADNPIENREVIILDKGNSLFFDPLSSRYFKSDFNKIKAAQNDLNEQILTDPFGTGVSLNDFYREIGLTPTSIGEDMGWNLEIGKLDVYLSAQMINDDSEYKGTPCGVLNYRVPPKYGF